MFPLRMIRPGSTQFGPGSRPLRTTGLLSLRARVALVGCVDMAPSAGIEALQGVTVLTYGNEAYGTLMLNVLHHMHRMPGAPKLIAHGLDDAGHDLCLKFLEHLDNGNSKGRIECVRADCCTSKDGKERRSSLPIKSLVEAILNYKLRAVHAQLVAYRHRDFRTTVFVLAPFAFFSPVLSPRRI